MGLLNSGPNGIPQHLSSCVRVTSSAGYGSTESYARTYINVIENTGSSIKYISDAVLGDRFVIRDLGFYLMMFGELYGTGNTTPVISVNKQSAPGTIPDLASRITPPAQITASIVNITITTGRWLNPGDIVRCMDTTSNNGGINNSDYIQFHIMRVI